MFSSKSLLQSQSTMIAAQSVTIAAQSESIKAQADTIKSLALSAQKSDDEIAMLTRQRDDASSKVQRLEGLFAELGIDLKAIDCAGMWWSRAKEFISVTVDADKSTQEGQFINDEQRNYAVMQAATIVKSYAE